MKIVWHRNAHHHNQSHHHVSEPKPAALVRDPLVIDSSMIGSMLFDAEKQDAVKQKIRDKQLHAPYLIDFEVADMAIEKVTDESMEEYVQRVMEIYQSFPVQRHVVEIGTVLSLALMYGLSVQAAAYLWLASKLHAPLATFDEELAAAARQYLGGDFSDDVL